MGKNFLGLLGGPGHALLENFEKIVLRIGCNCISGHQYPSLIP